MTGLHLIIDAEGCRSTFKLTDLEHTYNFLASIPHLVRLEPLGLPHVVRATDKANDGVTGFQLLTTSHASLHSWSNGKRQGMIHLDVFSCENFDDKELVREFRAVYEPTEVEVRLLRRI